MVAKGLTYPTSIAVGEDGTVYVAESGYAYGPKPSEARILKVSPEGSTAELDDNFEEPINGLAISEETLYISHRGKITTFCLQSEQREALLTGLPSVGDHQNNDIIVEPDGIIYFAQGTTTNAGVVGSDNFLYAWADRYPEVHDIPSRDLTLTDQMYTDVVPDTVDPTDKSFCPLRNNTRAGRNCERPGTGRWCHSSSHTGGKMTGSRSPYGLCKTDDDHMYAINLGYDDRGVRAVRSSRDWLVWVKEGSWYGWPDFAGVESLTHERFASERGQNRKPLISDPPEVAPPLARFPPRYSPIKIGTAPEEFGLGDRLLVAVFGDADPLSADLEEPVPAGVLSVNRFTGDYEWFAKNSEQPRYGRLGAILKESSM